MTRLRRAVHFVPGGNQKMLDRSLELPADSLVLDLEDAVTPDRKDAARAAVAAWLRDADFGGRERIVRMNPLDSPWGERDLGATMAHPPDAYLVPKVRGRDDLLQIDAVLTRLETEHDHPRGAVKLIVIATETPQGVLNLRDLPGAPRVDALTWGAEDLSAELGARRTRDDRGFLLDVFRHARAMTLLSAAAGGVAAIDTVYVDVRDSDGLRRDCLEAAHMGFSGKLTIHPSQIDVVNEVFTPSPEEVAESRELLEAFEENRREGRMTFRFRGRMVDVPHLNRARVLLDRARQAGVGDGGETVTRPPQVGKSGPSPSPAQRRRREGGG